MKKPLLIAASLLISVAAFAQKKELKEIEKQIRKGDLTSAQSGLNAIKGSVEGKNSSRRYRVCSSVLLLRSASQC